MSEPITNDSPVAYAFDRTIILADGSEWSGTAGEEQDTPSLWIWLDSGYEMVETFMAFNNPEKTRTIKAVIDSKINYDTRETIYENYTRLTDIKISGNKIRIQLMKGRDST